MKHLPEIEATSVANLAASLPWITTDMLMITKAQTNGYLLGPGPQAVDDSVHGVISERMRQQDFVGAAGSHLLFHFPDGRQRYIVLVGLGQPKLVDQTALSTAFRLVLGQAAALKINRLTVPMVGLRKRLGCSLRLSDAAFTIASLAAQQRDAVDQPFPRLLEFYSTPQAKRYLRTGLASLCAAGESGSQAA